MSVTMIEDIRTDFRKLIAAYEAQRVENGSLKKKLQECMDMNEEYRKQIFELEKEIDSLRLAAAMTMSSGGKKEARERIDRMIKAVDKCISMVGNVRESDDGKEHHDQGCGARI